MAQESLYSDICMDSVLKPLRFKPTCSRIRSRFCAESSFELEANPFELWSCVLYICLDFCVHFLPPVWIPYGIAFVAYYLFRLAKLLLRINGPLRPRRGPGARRAPARAQRARPPARRPLAPGAPPLGPLVPPTQGVSIRMALAGQGARVQGTYKYGACKRVGGQARSVKNH